MANARSGEERLSISLGRSTVVGTIGLMTCVALLIGLFLFYDRSYDGMGKLLEKTVAALAMAAAYALICALTDRMSTKRGELALCLVAVAGFAAYSAGMAIPEDLYVAHVICAALAAVGIAALTSIWFVGWCIEQRRYLHGSVAIAAGAGLLLCLGEFFFASDVRKAVSVVIGVTSIVCAFIQQHDHVDATPSPPRLDAKKTDARSRIQLESTIMLAVINVQFGYLVSSTSTGLVHGVAAMLITAVLVCALVAVDAMGREQRLSEDSIYPLTVPLTVTAFVCMYLFGGGLAHVAALCLLTIVDTVYLILGFVALNRHVTLMSLSPLRIYGRARAINSCAFAGGIALGFAAGWAFHTGTIHGIQVTVAIAIAYVFVASFFHKSRFPDSTMNTDGSAGFAPAPEKGQWKRRCQRVSEHYGLSERQHEVLCLIGQGRNAEYVANTLTISVSTVQTHIRNIYQKLNVHSRQELLDLIENTKLYGED